MVLPTVRPRFPELSAIADKFGRCLYQGNVTNGGEHVRRFEEKLTEYLRAPTLAFNNGQTALITMLMAAGIGPGSEVVLPSYTFSGTAHAVAMLGSRCVFSDIKRETLTIDPEDVARKVTKDTIAILGVDIYGICCDYAEIHRIADENNLYCLFDSAPAFGSMWGAFPTGKFGDGQIFSFHATKPFSTMEGGCLSTQNTDLLVRAKRIRDFGQTEERECTHIGLNGKMTEVAALIGLENLKDWREYRHKRTTKVAQLMHRLHPVEGVRPLPLTLSSDPSEPQPQWPIWTYYPIFIEDDFGKSRDEVLTYLNSQNIMARKYYSPGCHRLKPYANGQNLPVTEYISDRVIALPLYADMRDEEMDYIADTLRDAKK